MAVTITIPGTLGQPSKTVDITSSLKSLLDQGQTLSSAWNTAVTQVGGSPQTTPLSQTSLTSINSTYSSSFTTGSQTLSQVSTTTTTPTTQSGTSGGTSTTSPTSGTSGSGTTQTGGLAGGGTSLSQSEILALGQALATNPNQTPQQLASAIGITGTLTSTQLSAISSFMNTNTSGQAGGLEQSATPHQIQSASAYWWKAFQNHLAANTAPGSTPTQQQVDQAVGSANSGIFTGYGQAFTSAGALSSLVPEIQKLSGGSLSLSLGSGTLSGTYTGSTPSAPTAPAAPTAPTSGPTIIGTGGGTVYTGNHNNPGAQPGTTISTDGSVNPFSPGTTTTVSSLGTVQTLSDGINSATNSVGNTAQGLQPLGQLTTEQQLATQQAELNRQQLEGALNQRGISESGRGDLLRDIQGLQSELQVGQTAPARQFSGGGAEIPDPRAPFGGQPAPTASPTGQPVNATPAFKPLEAPEISQLQEPDAFNDLRAALGAAQAAEASKLGQNDPMSAVGDAAEAAAMRQLSTIVPGGFGIGTVDPFLALERTKNGVGNNGRNLADPQDIFNQELDDRRKSREKSQLDLSASILSSFRRAQSIQAQQDELLKQFHEFAPTVASGGNLGLGQQSFIQQQQIREQLQKLEQAKLSMAERVQREWKRWQANDKARLSAPKKGPAGRVGPRELRKRRNAAGQHQAHHELVGRDYLTRKGVSADAMNPNGLTNLQALMVAKTAGQIEQQLSAMGREG